MENKPFFENNRRYLHNLVPLSGPFSVNVEVSSICNIKCKYCLHSVEQKMNSLGNMSLTVFTEIVSQMKKFQNKLEKLVINGVGEPLCNPVLPEMLSIAKQSNISKKIEFFTNGTLLTPEVSRAIINAGVDRIKISLQGLNDEKYEKVCGKAINFNMLFDNIAYLASIKGNTELFIKIIDLGLDDNYDLFLKQFSFADCLYVEHVQPWFTEVDYSDMYKESGEQSVNNKYGLAITPPSICPVPFYRFYIDVCGNVFYCYSIRQPAPILNCLEVPLLSIWNGIQRNSFLCSMLKYGRSCSSVCEKCTMMCDSAFSEYDRLDGYAEGLLNHFNKNYSEGRINEI